MSTTEDSLTPAPPKPKRELFKRPTWARQDPSAAPQPPDNNVFGRTGQSYAEIIREREQKRLRKLEKERARAEREKEDSLSSSAIKRRRITDEDYQRFGISKSPVKQDIDDSEDSSPVKSHLVRPARKALASLPQTDCNPPPQVVAPPVISIDDDSDHDVIQVKQAPGLDRPPDDDEEEELFPELAAAARERRRKREESEQLQQAEREASAIKPVGDSYSRVLAPSAADPILSLLVTSRMEDTRPLCVKRRMTQRLQEVRQVWCDKQGFDQATADTVFLTYRLRKLHDVTTCKSLGLKFDADGQLLHAGHTNEGEHPGQVVLEAVTEEIFEQLKKERDAARLKKQPEPDYEYKTSSGKAKTAGTKAGSEDELIRLVLKAKGHDELKLRVKKKTTFSRIANACKIDWKLESSADVTLMFDGEGLEPDKTLDETEIEDKDCIDVLVR